LGSLSFIINLLGDYLWLGKGKFLGKDRPLGDGCFSLFFILD
jgi:hypothetical protein